MKTLGIVGGLAPESTIIYYRHALAEYAARVPDGSAPSIVIDSIDVNHLLALVGAGRLAELTEYLLTSVRRLAAAGCHFALIASNTPHLVFPDVQRQSPIPLLSIVQAACEAAAELGLKRVGLFGTRFTMQGRFYPDVFEARGITLVTPQPEEQAFVHDKYTKELLKNVILPETRARLLEIARRMKERDGIEAVLLAGTELSLILRQSDLETPRILDTTRIHAQAAIRRLIA
jgi:aspartate racemase